jgi:hypothetical protein
LSVAVLPLTLQFSGSRHPELVDKMPTPPDTISVAVLSPGAALTFATDVVFATDTLNSEKYYSATIVSNTMCEVMYATRGHLAARVSTSARRGILSRLMLCPRREDVRVLVDDSLRWQEFKAVALESCVEV